MACCGNQSKRFLEKLDKKKKSLDKDLTPRQVRIKERKIRVLERDKRMARRNAKHQKALQNKANNDQKAINPPNK